MNGGTAPGRWIQTCAMASINQNAYTSALPNFRNLGILLRILLIVNVAAIGAAIVRAPTLTAALGELAEISAVVQPLLIVSLLVLVTLNGFLKRLPYLLGVIVVVTVTVGLTVMLVVFVNATYRETPGPVARYAVLAMLTTAVLLAYLDLRGRALSPALAEARLQALQARIRPHFLFNSINAVVSLIRQEPKRAEAALEDLADLFRVGDGRQPRARAARARSAALPAVPRSRAAPAGRAAQSRVAHGEDAGRCARSTARAAAAARKRGLPRHRAEGGAGRDQHRHLCRAQSGSRRAAQPVRAGRRSSCRQQDGARQYSRAVAAPLRCRGEPRNPGPGRHLPGAHRDALREGTRPHERASSPRTHSGRRGACARAAARSACGLLQRACARDRRRSRRPRARRSISSPRSAWT